MKYHLTPVSRNRKVGPIPVSTSHRDTCPTSCPFLDAGCYAQGGPLSLWWGRMMKQPNVGSDWQTFVAKVRALPAGQLWRHNQAGDLPGTGDNLGVMCVDELTSANGRSRGFTYTHKPLTTQRERDAIARANRDGFTINLSANSPAHADELAALEIGPVVTVLPSDQTTNSETPAGRTIVICPAVTRDDVSCATCQLCQRQRETVVGFPAHGSQRLKVTAVTRGEKNVRV